MKEGGSLEAGASNARDVTRRYKQRRLVQIRYLYLMLHGELTRLYVADIRGSIDKLCARNT